MMIKTQFQNKNCKTKWKAKKNDLKNNNNGSKLISLSLIVEMSRDTVSCTLEKSRAPKRLRQRIY